MPLLKELSLCLHHYSSCNVLTVPKQHGFNGRSTCECGNRIAPIESSLSHLCKKSEEEASRKAIVIFLKAI